MPDEDKIAPIESRAVVELVDRLREFYNEGQDDGMSNTERYPWLTIHEDGTFSANIADTTPAEMDRRVVISQELAAGRVVLAQQHAGAVEDGRAYLRRALAAEVKLAVITAALGADRDALSDALDSLGGQ